MLTRNRARHPRTPRTPPRQAPAASSTSTPALGVIVPNHPILTLGLNGSPGNFSKFRDASHTYLSQLYGIAARLLITGVVPNPPLVIDLDAESTSSSSAAESPNSPDGVADLNESGVSASSDTSISNAEIRRLTYSETVRANVREREEIRRALPKMYAFIWAHMSPESRSKVKEDPEFPEIEVQSCCLRLWKRIVATHLIGEHSVPVIAESTALARYYSLRQGSQESIIDFKRKFNDQIVALQTLKLAVPSQKQQAADFLLRLDPARYNQLRLTLENNAARKAEEFPATLQAMFQIAQEYKVISSVPSQSSSSSSSTAFVTQSTPHKRSHSSANNSPNSSQSSRSSGSQSRKGSVPSRPCPACHGPAPYHWLRDCPIFSRFLENNPVDSSRSPAAPVLTTTTTTTNSARPPVSTPSNSGRPSRIHSAHVTLGAGSLAYVSRSLTRQDAVLLDNQATASLFCNRSLLTGITASQTPQYFQGITTKKPIVCNRIGTFRDFGPTWWNSRATANVISFSQAVSHMDISYNRSTDSFVAVSKDGNEYVFSNVNGLYVWYPEIGTRPAISEPTRTFIYTTAASKEEAKDYILSTVEQKESQYSPRELRAAKKAHEFMRILGTPSAEAAIRILSQSHNNPVTQQDIRNAVDIYGPSLNGVRGSTTRKKARIIAAGAPQPYNRNVQSLSVDIFFVNKVAYFVSVSRPMGLVMITHLGHATGARATPNIRRVLFAQLDEYVGRNFIIDQIFSDGEGAVVALSSELAARGIVLNVTAVGEHVGQIEKWIRLIKERARGIFSTLPYRLPANLEPALFQHVAFILNLMIHDGSSTPVCPREAFTGRRFDVSTHLRVAFGDYIEAFQPYSNNSMQSRTEPAIALGHTGNAQGSVRMFNLRTSSFMTRDQFTTLPMPQHIIDRMNRISSNPKIGSHDDLDFVMLNQREVINEDILHHNDPLPDEPNSVEDPVIEADVSTSPSSQSFDSANESEGAFLYAPTTPENRYSGLDALNALVPPTTSDDDDDGDSDDHSDSSSMPGLIPIESEVLVSSPHSIESLSADIEPDTSISPAFSYEDESLTVEAEPVLPDPVEPMPPEMFDPRPSRRSRRLANRGERAYYHPRTGATISRHDYELATHRIFSNISVKEGLRSMRDLAEPSIRAEFKQMIDRQVFVPVMSHEYRGHKLIYSFMFLKKKMTPEGLFDKLKSRFVAMGNTQDRSLTIYSQENISSPTVALTHVFTICAIAASAERPQYRITVDIPGAFLHALMGNNLVFMIVDKELAAILVSMYPDYARYLRHDGTLVVKLLRALYGCIESPKLWYDHLYSVLFAAGFRANPIDPCVFNSVYREHQITIAVYVDDLLITCGSMEGIDYTLDVLKNAFGDITIKSGDVLSYLGMSFDYTVEDQVKVTMKGYIDDLLSTTDTTGFSTSPTSPNLFLVNNVNPLNVEDKKTFHTVVAKLLYLAKRARPDLLTAVSYLASRVQSPSSDDMQKLSRCLKYLNNSKDMGMILSCTYPLSIHCNIDASHDTHPDAKGHGGMTITLGKGPIVSKSSRIKINTKSSCETELMAAAEHLGEALSLQKFMFYQGYCPGRVILYQDNQATIHMLKNGRSSNSRSKHIDIKYFWIKDYLERGDIEVEYKPTDEMEADILSKPLVGEQFITKCMKLLNWK